MNEQTFVLSAEFSKLTTRVNHTFDITFNTSEMPAEQGAKLLPLLNQQGTLAFKFGTFTDEQIHDLPEAKEFPEQKSSSQRLRAVLFIWHKQQGHRDEDFEAFYKMQMEILINQIKNKLEPS